MEVVDGRGRVQEMLNPMRDQQKISGKNRSQDENRPYDHEPYPTGEGEITYRYTLPFVFDAAQNIFSAINKAQTHFIYMCGVLSVGWGYCIREERGFSFFFPLAVSI